MNIKFSPPDISQIEIDAVIDTLKSGWITTGPKTAAFEKQIADYCKIGNDAKAVCLNSATAALELTLRILGIGPGDEVITSAYTYTASASVIDHVGAKIVIVDTEPDSYFFDYTQLENAITKHTKAIIPVDIAGVPCDYNAIYNAINVKKDLFSSLNNIHKAIGRVAVISDAAHSFGATFNGINAGGYADFTCFSFHAVKNLTTAEGGAVVWKNIAGINNQYIYNEFMLWGLHGQNKSALQKTQKGNWEYDIERLGYKYNMTDIMAAIGLAQLERYDSLLKRRSQIIQIYKNGLDSKIEVLQHFGKQYSSSCHLFLTRVKNIDLEQRNNIIIKLAERGIATNVHYKPLPLHSAYKKKGFDIINYPNSFNQYQNEITLPLHTLLTDEEVLYIIANYNDIVCKL